MLYLNLTRKVFEQENHPVYFSVVYCYQGYKSYLSLHVLICDGNLKGYKMLDSDCNAYLCKASSATEIALLSLRFLYPTFTFSRQRGEANQNKLKGFICSF